MRMRGHAEHDDARYVPAELVEEWRGKDPIDRFTRRLLEEFGFSRQQLAEQDEIIARLVEEDAEFADQSPYPEGSQAQGGVFAS